MSTVNGKFVITLDGVEEVITFTGTPYAAFWLAQKAIIDFLQASTAWGLAPLLGLPPVYSGDALGDVSYSYAADFSDGGTSEGANVWHGIPAAAAQAIAAALKSAVAPVKP